MTRDTKHILGADALRGVAILMVLAYHAFGPVYGWSLPWKGWWRDFGAPPSTAFLVGYPLTFGWAGVALFFVLSGFCIHLSFLRSSGFTIPRFLWQRAWRICPAYALALVSFTWLTHESFSPSGAKQFLTHAFLVHNFHNSTFFGTNPSFWSIATEIQLYLLFPLLLWLRRKWSLEHCLGITFATAMVWRIGALALSGFPDAPISALFCSPAMTWFDWTLGAYVAEKFNSGKTAFRRHVLWFLLLFAGFVLSTICRPMVAFSFSLAAGASAIVLDWVLVRGPSRYRLMRMLSGLLVFVGTISYSLYLWHQPLLFRFSWHIGQYLNAPATLIGTGICIFTVAWLSYFFVERVGISFGKRIWANLSDGACPKPARCSVSRVVGEREREREMQR